VHKMNKVIENEIGISEYDFTKYLFDAFNLLGLKEESEYIDMWLDQCEKEGEFYRSPAFSTSPYKDGFGEEGGEEFLFIDDYEDDFINTKRFRKYRKVSKNKPKDETFWLLSPKSAKSLNTQFNRDERVQLHPETGYEEGEEVILSSAYGEHRFTVHLNEDVRPNCAVVTNNTIGVNYLTPSILSEEGENACYQEVKVEIRSTD